MSYLEQKNYEIIWDVIEKLFPDLKSASDYGSIIHAHPNCYYEIKDYCETHYGIERPSVNQIGEVILLIISSFLRIRLEKSLLLTVESSVIQEECFFLLFCLFPSRLSKRIFFD